MHAALAEHNVENVAVEFSALELKEEFQRNLWGETAEAEEIEDTLLKSTP